jgi:type II secretory pathway pseudopilin PulG
MTLLELMVVTLIIALMVLTSLYFLQAARTFTATNVTQVDLQEQARKVLDRMTERLREAGRFTAAGPTRPYPVVFKSDDYPTALGYSYANQHSPKHAPRALPGTLVNGGDPTLESDEIIFRLPRDLDGDGLRATVDATTQRLEIEWGPEEYGFFVCPGPNGINQIEFRNSAESAQQLAAGLPVQGEVMGRYVDRLQIQDYTSDPTLTTRQLRVTVYLTHPLGLMGNLDTSAGNPAQQILTVALSALVDMRNNVFE